MQADKEIKNIDELLETLEEILDEYTDLYERRDIINIIEFARRQKEKGRTLVDIIWWLNRIGKDVDYADINALIDKVNE
jgi:flagellar motility protein MotE (MotC chaperone)